MNFHILTLSSPAPSWVNEAFAEYQKRLAPQFHLQLTEIPFIKRIKNTNINELLKKDGMKMLEFIRPSDWVVALDSRGKTYSSEKFADQIANWQQEYKTIFFLIGAPEGMPENCMKRANTTLSLSQFTFPHTLAKVLLAEQLYRAKCILTKHPYHK